MGAGRIGIRPSGFHRHRSAFLLAGAAAPAQRDWVKLLARSGFPPSPLGVAISSGTKRPGRWWDQEKLPVPYRLAGTLASALGDRPPCTTKGEVRDHPVNTVLL